MFIAACRLTLDVAALGAVRAKKQLLRRVVDRVKARFTVAVAELPEEGDRAAVGFAVLATSSSQAKEAMSRLLRFVEEMSVAPVTDVVTEITKFGDGSEDSGEHPGFAIPKGERTLAEAEGLGAWEHRPSAPQPTAPGRGQAQTPRPSAGGPPLSLEEARARARALRKPRDWEQPPPRRTTKDG